MTNFLKNHISGISQLSMEISSLSSSLEVACKEDFEYLEDLLKMREKIKSLYEHLEIIYEKRRNEPL